MKIPIHALALLVLLDSPVALAAAKKYRHQKAAGASVSAAKARTLQEDEDAAPKIIVDDFDAASPSALDLLRDCIPCTNIPTNHMLVNNKTCATYSYAWERRCGTEYGWWGRDGYPEHCQYSCWVNGVPYASQGGAPCCDRAGYDDIESDVVTTTTTTTTTTTDADASNAIDTTSTADAAVDIEESDNEMAAILSEIEAEIADVQDVIDLKSTMARDKIQNEDADVQDVNDLKSTTSHDVTDPVEDSTSSHLVTEEEEETTTPFEGIETKIGYVQEVIDLGSIVADPVEDSEEEEEDLQNAIDLEAPIPEEGQSTGVDIGGDIPDVSDEALKEIAAKELAIVEDVIDELESETFGSSEPTTIEPSMNPTSPHPTLISTTDFDVVDDHVVILKEPLVDPDNQNVWLAPTHEPTTVSPTITHAWLVPTPNPTKEPTANPTPVPTSSPTKMPSMSPTQTPTDMPVTSSPTPGPSAHPTPSPTGSPSAKPSPSPTKTASASPSEMPSSSPTASPSKMPRYVRK